MVDNDNPLENLISSLALRLGFAELDDLGSDVESGHSDKSKEGVGSKGVGSNQDDLESPQQPPSTDQVSRMLTDKDAKLLESLANAIVEKRGTIENSLKFLADLPAGFDSVDVRLGSYSRLSLTPKQYHGDGGADEELAPEKSIPTDPPPGLPEQLSDGPPAVDAATGELFSPSTQRYEIKKFLARGGIGKVSVALDREFNREVAFKEIRSDRHSNDEQVNRFWVEAQVTGNLEHPGIVPVYSLGKRDNDEPFYAMRFIRGKSMTDAIKEFHSSQAAGDDSSRQIQFRKLLQSFVSVCNTIHFAHDRNVIHRDIKPDNVMLGSFGETLVVDWGLAKTLGEDANDDQDKSPNESTGDAFDLNDLKISSIPDLVNKATTQQGAIMGTIGFMSPEQLLGWQDKIDARSDVFSLGAMLYAILSGANPNAKESFGKTTENTLAGSTKPVRQVNPEVPKSLEAVVTKSMSPKPTERYQTAADLASDIEAYLADEPVTAIRDPLRVRIRRWLRRHPAITSATLASIALTIVGLAIGLGVVGNFNRRLEKANDDLTLANQREVAERERAGGNFKIAESAVETYLTKTAAEPNLATPQFNSIRKSLLETAIPFYEKFLAQRPDELGYDFSRGKAHFRLGQIYLETGDYDRGIEQFKLGLATFGSLQSDEPDNPEWIRWRCRCKNELVGCYFRQDNHSLAIETAEESIKELKGLLADSPDDTDILGDLANITSNIGASLYATARFKEAEESSREHAELVEKLTTIEGSISLRNRFQLVVNLNNIGAIKNQQQKWRAAFDELVKAINMGNELIKEFPNVPRFRHTLAQAYHNVGRSLRGMKSYSDSIANFKVADSFDSWLSQSYPNVAKYQLSQGMNYKSMGTTFLEWRRPKDALENFLKSEKVFQKLIDAYPDVSEYQYRLALTCSNLGMYEIFPNDLEKRKNYSQRAVDSLILLVEKKPQYGDFRYHLAMAQVNLGLCFRDGKQFDEAVKLFQAAAKNNEQLDAKSLRGRSARYNTFFGLGECYVELQQHSKAADAWDQAAFFADNPTMKHIFEVRTAKSSALANQFDRAEKAVEKILEFPQQTAETFFRVAEIYAICAVNSEDEQSKERFTKLATKFVQKCKTNGGSEQNALLQKINNNPWLNSLGQANK